MMIMNVFPRDADVKIAIMNFLAVAAPFVSIKTFKSWFLQKSKHLQVLIHI